MKLSSVIHWYSDGLFFALNIKYVWYILIRYLHCKFYDIGVWIYILAITTNYCSMIITVIDQYCSTYVYN